MANTAVKIKVERVYCFECNEYTQSTVESYEDNYFKHEVYTCHKCGEQDHDADPKESYSYELSWDE